MKNKTRGLLFYIIILILVLLGFEIKANAVEGLHYMLPFGQTRDYGRVFSRHQMQFSGITKDAFCLTQGASAANYYVNPLKATYMQAYWPDQNKYQILRYAATYMTSDYMSEATGTDSDEIAEDYDQEDMKPSGEQYNYSAMQGVAWSVFGALGSNWTRIHFGADPLIYMDYSTEYDNPSVRFTPQADKFISNMIIMDKSGGTKYFTPEKADKNDDLCKECGGYGYKIKVTKKTQRKYEYEEFDSETGKSYGTSYEYDWQTESSSSPTLKKQKNVDLDMSTKAMNATRTEEKNVVGSTNKNYVQSYESKYGYSSWYDYEATGRYKERTTTTYQKVLCDAPKCDNENYFAYTYDQYLTENDVDLSKGDINSWIKTWKNYCEMKFFTHVMSQVPSYAARTAPRSMASDKLITLKWTGSKYETQLSDTNYVSSFYVFDTKNSGYHIKYTKGRTILYYNGSTDPDYEMSEEEGINLYKNQVGKINTFEAECSFMKDNQTAEVIFWKNSKGQLTQNFMTIEEGGGDPTKAYISVTIESPYQGDAKCEVKADVEIIDLNGKVVDYMLPGEKYKLRYIYTYEGGSKCQGLDKYDVHPRYAEHYFPMYDQFAEESVSLPEQISKRTNGSWGFRVYPKYLNKVSLIGKYEVYTSPYIDKETKKTWLSDKDSELTNKWNIELYLDAENIENTIKSCLEENEQWKNFSYKKISGKDAWETEYKGTTEEGNSTTTKELDQAAYMKVEQTKKTNNNSNEMKVTWWYEVPYQVFRTPKVDSEAYIGVEKAHNDTKTYPTTKYKLDMSGRNMKIDGTIQWKFGPYKFTRVKYDMETAMTNNAIYPASYQLEKDWKLITDIDVTQFHVSTGDGKTSPVDILSKKYLNHQFYYAIKLVNDKATIESGYIKEANGQAIIDKLKNKSDHTIKNITGITDVVETDVTTQLMINGNDVLELDHIETGTTLIQRTLPYIVTINQAKTNNFKISVNTKDGSYNNRNDGFRTYYETEFDESPKNNNVKSDTDKVVKAINPSKLNERPKAISNAESLTPITKFDIKLDGSNIKVTDTSDLGSINSSKAYKDKSFAFNTAKVSNGVYAKTNSSGTVIKETDKAFEEGPYYKYSNTSFRTLNKGSWSKANTDNSDYSPETQKAKEEYRFTKILFRSNYTSKYVEDDNVTEDDIQKINDMINDGSESHTEDTINEISKAGWVDFAKDQEKALKDKKAIVSAGQGFEIIAQVTYTNNNLTQYREKYVEKYAAINNSSNIMSSKNKKIGEQYANHFYKTVYDGTDDTGLAKLTDLNGNVIDIYGSNVYEDLYASLSDNKETAYSFSGIDDTMQIWKMYKHVDCDETANKVKITYTYILKGSSENGVESDFQSMKFYTNQLEKDSLSDTSKKHLINLWTAVFPALEIDDDIKVTGGDAWNFDTETRYLGDVFQGEYAITTTAGDDSIVHIVQ